MPATPSCPCDPNWAASIAVDQSFVAIVSVVLAGVAKVVATAAAVIFHRYLLEEVGLEAVCVQLFKLPELVIKPVEKV